MFTDRCQLVSIQRISGGIWYGGNWVIGVKFEDVVGDMVGTDILENVFLLLIWRNGSRPVVRVSWAINIAGDIWEDR